MQSAEQQRYDDLYNENEEGIASAKKDIELSKEFFKMMKFRVNEMGSWLQIPTKTDMKSNLLKLSLLRWEYRCHFNH
jgi:hypothetical protein